MKTKYFLILALFVLALILAACGPGVQGPLSGGGTQPPAEGVASQPPQAVAVTSTLAAGGGTPRVFATLGIGNPTFPPPPAMGGQMSTSTPSPNDLLPAYINAARRWLAGDLPVPAAQVKYIADEATEWPDSCLGLGKPNESCLQAITPGYRITLEVNGTQYIVRTDETADVVRLEELP